MILASVIVIGTIVYAVLIEGAMETVSKVALWLLVLLAAAKGIFTFINGRSAARLLPFSRLAKTGKAGWPNFSLLHITLQSGFRKDAFRI